MDAQQLTIHSVSITEWLSSFIKVVMLTLLFFMVIDGLKDRISLAGGHVIAVTHDMPSLLLICVQ